MTTGSNDYAECAAQVFNRRDVEGLAIREEVFFDSVVLMPSAQQQEG